jgi:ComF family protein
MFMASHVATIGRALLDLVLPHRCAACGDVVDGDPGFCPDCFRDLRFITSPACAQCGVPFEIPVVASTRCGDCLISPPSWSAARAVWRYDGSARTPILSLKYGDRTDLVAMFARHLQRLMADLPISDAILVPIPLHRWRLFQRTFNQSGLLAQGLGKRSGLPVSQTVLRRIKRTQPQQGLTRSQRQKNVQAAFQVHPVGKHMIQGKTIILVDDVLTTGATAEAAAKALLRAGAADIKLLTLARVVNIGTRAI